jgi:hypothetical protein
MQRAASRAPPRGNSTSARSAMRGAASSRTTTTPARPLQDHYLPCAAERGPLPSRRAAARRGLQLGLVRLEPHVRRRRHLRRLPRAARRETARTGQRRLCAVPLGGEIRRGRATISTRPGTPGAACAACHMKTETYMVVDPRHDHSFRIPRPDLSASLGVPNACGASATRSRRRTGPRTRSASAGPSRSRDSRALRRRLRPRTEGDASARASP